MAISPHDQPAIEAIKTRISAGDFAGARAACEAFFANVNDASRQAPVRIWLGFIEQKCGALPAAIEQYELALKSDMRNPQLLHQLGLAHFQQHRLERAELLYREAIQLETRFPIAHYNLGVLLQRKGDWYAARHAFEAALAQQPRFPEALTNLANTLVELGENELAEPCYRQALAINPRLANAHHGLGLHYQRTQQQALAVRHFAAAVDCNPLLLDAWLDLAESHHASGNDPQALACVDQVLTRDGDHDIARFKRAQYAGEQPPALPAGLVEHLYAGMANTYEEHLTGRLEYRVPELLMDALEKPLRDISIQLGRQPSALDLGCGTGLFGARLRPRVATLTGVDLSGAMLGKARARGIYDDLVEAELLNYLLGCERTFDLVAAADVFMYVGRLDELFASVAEHLAPPGLFGFSTECPADLDRDYRLQSSSRYTHHPDYVSHLAGWSGLQVICRIDATLRTENGAPVAGYIFVLRKN